MATVPTNTLEVKLRKLYLRWIAELDKHQDDLHSYIEQFKRDSLRLINREGSKIARLGAQAGFPTPKMIDLSLVADHIYDDMQTAAIKAGIATGLNARDIARQMLNAGLDSSYKSLERLARTEVVSAYWENQWDSVEDLGLVMVWSAESGSRTCYQCLAKDGLIVTDKSIRDHPNGRCTLVPETPERANRPRSKGKNPHFDRLPWDGKVPRDFDMLAKGVDAALLQNHGTARALKSMVSQGWSSSDAFRWVQKFNPTETAALSRAEVSQVKRALEHRAQELWEKLAPLKTLPEVLYHAGHDDIGLMSYTPNESYAIQLTLNLGRVKNQHPRPKQIFKVITEHLVGKVVGYIPKGQAGGIKEYILLGGLRSISSVTKDLDFMGSKVATTVIDADIGGVVMETPQEFF